MKKYERIQLSQVTALIHVIYIYILQKQKIPDTANVNHYAIGF